MVNSQPWRYLPNFITLINLYCGCLGTVWALNNEIQWAVYAIWFCAILDLFDGLTARALGVASELGKQLDSLSDLVSFGLLPAAIIFSLSSGFLEMPWPYVSFVLTLFSAMRLAKFNLDPDQSVDFKGLPTPAYAVLVSSFPAILDQIDGNLRLELENPIYWFFMVVILCYLMISNIRLFGFKFQNLSWTDNKLRYVFIVIAVTTALIWGILAIPLIILSYLVLSLFWQFQ